MINLVFHYIPGQQPSFISSLSFCLWSPSWSLLLAWIVAPNSLLCLYSFSPHSHRSPVFHFFHWYFTLLLKTFLHCYINDDINQSFFTNSLLELNCYAAFLHETFPSLVSSVSYIHFSPTSNCVPIVFYNILFYLPHFAPLYHCYLSTRIIIIYQFTHLTLKLS